MTRVAGSRVHAPPPRGISTADPGVSHARVLESTAFARRAAFRLLGPGLQPPAGEREMHQEEGSPNGRVSLIAERSAPKLSLLMAGMGYLFAPIRCPAGPGRGWSDSLGGLQMSTIAGATTLCADLDLRAALHRHFGFADFRPGQEEAIRAVLAGEDVLAVLPTGGGKSLCYQLPALLLDRPVVVGSPLVSLMKDQTDSLATLGIEGAATLNSSMTAGERRRVRTAYIEGRIRILYLAPEGLATPAARELLVARARTLRRGRGALRQPVGA